MASTLRPEDLYPGLLITGSPRELSRYITMIHAAGYDFEPQYDAQFLGDAIVVVTRGGTIPVKEDITSAPAEPATQDSSVEKKLEDAVTLVNEINEEVGQPSEGQDAVTVEAAGEYEEMLQEAKDEVAAEEPKKPARRTRKPKADPAPETTQEG